LTAGPADSPSPPPPAPATPPQRPAPIVAPALTPTVAQSAEAKPSAVNAEPAPDLAQLWQQVHDLAAESPATQFMIESIEATGVRVAGGVVIVNVQSTMGSLGPPTPAQTAKIEALITKAAGRLAKIEARALATAPKQAASPPPAAPTDSSARAQAVNHPLVKRAMELFDAKLVRVDKPT